MRTLHIIETGKAVEKAGGQIQSYRKEVLEFCLEIFCSITQQMTTLYNCELQTGENQHYCTLQARSRPWERGGGGYMLTSSVQFTLIV